MKGLLFASFGTSYDDARVRYIDAVVDYLATQLPEYDVAQAYTSNMVRASLAKRGIDVPDVRSALEAFSDKGITEVFIQPGHLLLGEEFNKLFEQAEEVAENFDEIIIGDPLMSSSQDLSDLAEIIANWLPAQNDTALVLMGHGTPQFANVVYAAMNYHFQIIGRDDVYVGTVEAFPELDKVLELVKKKPYKKVVLAPLMLVAGDHAINDMAGDDEESWASEFKAAGYEVECEVTGLGALRAIQDLYLEHVKRVVEEGASA